MISPTFKSSNFNLNKTIIDVSPTNYASQKITEEVKLSVCTSITEFKVCTLNSSVNRCEEEAIGSSPCTAYCGRCKKYVHTLVECQDKGFLSVLFKLSSQFTFCCGKPEWDRGGIMHICSLCGLLLANLN